MNKKALTALIACFIPCFGFIGLQIIRNVFKDDFLMTRRGKEKLAKRKEENERIHQAYINGEFDVPETPAQDETPAEEPEKEETAHSREQDGENEGGESE